MLALILTATTVAQEKTTTIYLIRHAEKADGSDDPELSEAGKERTKKWGAYFEKKNITLYYTSLYKRSKLTATFTAAYFSQIPPPGTSKEMRFIAYDPANFSLKQAAQDNEGQNIVVVGHSNTIPAQINALLGKNIYPDIKEDEYGNLYIIKITGDKITHELVKI